MSKLKNKYKIGLTFGAFDPPHFAHELLFKNAKKICDRLIVCISDAEYIRKHKNRGEFMPLSNRMFIISKSRYVDEVDVQSFKFGKKEAIKKYGASVLIVGNDWSPSTYTGEGLGVPVVYLPRTEGVSSTIIRDGLTKK